MMHTPIRAMLAGAVLVAAACSGDEGPALTGTASPAADRQVNGNEPPAPTGVVDVALGDQSLTFWPFTGYDFSGARFDPINLVFTGDADPRQVRAALMELPGSGRPGPLAAFACSWSDAVGGPQATYGAHAGWVGSAIQMECGDYMGPRVHIRLFRQGNVTVGNAHYEILIPGTNEHEVLSWELAEQLVTADMARTGRLAASPVASDVITPAPYHRTVQAPIAAMLTASQVAGLGLLRNGDGTASIPNDGRAMIFALAPAKPPVSGTADKNFIIQFGQVIPKPFCAAGSSDYVYATGPIRVRLRSGITGQNYRSEWTAEGTLTLYPFSFSAGVIGPGYQGEVTERTITSITDGAAVLEQFSHRSETPDTGPTRGTRIHRLQVRENGEDRYSLEITC